MSGIGFLLSPAVADDSCQIRIEIPEMSANPGEVNFEIPIYLKNEIDTIGGFDLWLVLDRPDLMEFQTGNCYAAGTLSEDWENISCASIGESGHDLKIGAQANTALPMEFAIPPQDGQTAVIRVLAEIYEIPDSLWGETLKIFIMTDDLSNFGMIDNWGEEINPTWPDTNYFCIKNGSVTILYPPCGDFDLNGHVDLLDIVGLINCLYMTPGSECYSLSVDVNCDGSIDILDITGLIMNVYPPGIELDCCH